MPWTAIALVVAVFVLVGLLIVWLRQSDEPMEEGHGGNPGAGEDGSPTPGFNGSSRG